MRDEDSISTGKMLLGIFATIAVVVFVGWLLGWISLASDRPMSRYREETRAQTYDTSRQYVQGTNRDIARYCEQMRDAKEDSAKKAVAALIRSEVSSYNGELYDDNKDCVSEAKGY